MKLEVPSPAALRSRSGSTHVRARPLAVAVAVAVLGRCFFGGWSVADAVAAEPRRRPPALATPADPRARAASPASHTVAGGLRQRQRPHAHTCPPAAGRAHVGGLPQGPASSGPGERRRARGCAAEARSRVRVRGVRGGCFLGAYDRRRGDPGLIECDRMCVQSARCNVM